MTGPPAAGRSGRASWRARLYEIIFEAETPAGRAFDVILIGAIIVSVAAVVLESVESIRREHGPLLRAVEWGLTGLFTVEYLLRLTCVDRPSRYARSFLGIVDLLAIVPTYLALVLTGVQELMVVRAIRVLRVFRILKLGRFVRDARIMSVALLASRRKILVFFGALMTLILIVGTIAHLIEVGTPGFESIPSSMYWAVVTITTVGYGDVSPRTVPGKMLASLVMLMGYSIIAVPTGIVSVEIARATQGQVLTKTCPNCLREGHDADAAHCKYCGVRLE